MTTVTSLFEKAPMSAEAAQAAGLIDKLGHYLELQEYAKDKAGKDAEFLPLQAYALQSGSGGPVIATIGGEGPVVLGSSVNGSNPLNRNVMIGGDTVSEAFEAAANDDAVKAIVFRISTPGGSATASDQILNAVTRAQEAGKPVVISMGQYAASGGYYVAASADKIVAMPTTITGSIGVLGGKVALRDTFAKVGYNIESVDIGGEYVGALSTDEPFTQGQLAAFRGQLEDIYNDFTGKVAEGRGLPLDDVQEIAKGRVWTGAQATKIGLVDELGGFWTAVKLAKELGGIEDDKYRLQAYPRPKTTAEQLEQLLSGSVEAGQGLAVLQEITELPEVQAALEARHRAQADKAMWADLPIIK